MKKWTIVALFVLVVATATCPAAFAKGVGNTDMQPSVVRSIELESDASGDTVTIHISGNVPEISPFTLTSPDRIVVDLDECLLSKDIVPAGAGSGIVKAIRVGRHTGKVRIVLDTETLTGIDFDATKDENIITVHLSTPKNETQSSFQPPERPPASTIEPASPDNSGEEPANGGDIWEENTETFPENAGDDIWSEAASATDENLRASDLWDQAPSDVAEAESSGGLWDSADNMESTPPPP